jgi:ribose transport system substrate-binding protein
MTGALVIAACGSDDDTSSGETTAETADAGTTPPSDTAVTGDTTPPDGSGAEAPAGSVDEFNTQIEALVAEASAEQTQVPPTEGPPLVEGASVFIIPCAMVAQGCADSALAAQEAAEAVGWDVTFIDPAGDPTAMNNAVTQAISQGADGIITTAIDGPTIAGSLAEAKGAGIVSACFSCFDPEGLYDSGYPEQRTNYDHGYLAMASLYERTGRDLKVVMVNGPEYGISAQPDGREDGGRAFIDDCIAAGGSCELVEQTDVLTANFATSAPGQVVSVLRSHPEANALWGFADPVSALIIPAIQQAGIDVEISGIDPVEFNFDLIRADDLQRSSVSQPLSWIGYSLVDQVNRLLNGEEPVDENVRAKLITTENVPAEGVWDGDIDVQPLYLELWGVS